MIDLLTAKTPIGQHSLLSVRAARQDEETSLASAMQSGVDEHAMQVMRVDHPLSIRRRAANRLRRLTVEISQLVEARLPGGIHDLKVSADEQEIVLTGVCRSYYFKQIAQTVAMSVVARRRLVNLIEVRWVR